MYLCTDVPIRLWPCYPFRRSWWRGHPASTSSTVFSSANSGCVLPGQVDHIVVGIASQTDEHSFSRSFIPQTVAPFMRHLPGHGGPIIPLRRRLALSLRGPRCSIRRMLLEGSPVIVTMRPQESPSRRRTLCISSAGFRLTPLSQLRCFSVALTRSSPARFQEAPLPTFSKTWSQSTSTQHCVLRLLASLAPAHGRTYRVFRSSFTGTRFWHGGPGLPLAEFWLC